MKKYCKDCNDIISETYKCEICHGIMCKKCKIRRIDKDYCYICFTDYGVFDQ